MTIEEAEIDKMLRDYRAAVDAWINAIRQDDLAPAKRIP
jgi:hypothetical protein